MQAPKRKLQTKSALVLYEAVLDLTNDSSFTDKERQHLNSLKSRYPNRYTPYFNSFLDSCIGDAFNISVSSFSADVEDRRKVTTYEEVFNTNNIKTAAKEREVRINTKSQKWCFVFLMLNTCDCIFLSVKDIMIKISNKINLD